MDKPKIGDYVNVISDTNIDTGPWTSKVIDIKGTKFKTNHNDTWYEIPEFSHIHEKDGKRFFTTELVTSDDIPDVLGPWEPVKNKYKKDKLYQKRLKQNPDLKKNIKKIGENLMKTVVTFKSSNQRTISSQWHKMNTMNHTGSVSWKLSNPEVSGKTYTFTLEYYGKDQYLEGERLDNMVYSGVTYTVKQSKNESVERQESIVALIESGDDASLLADILLQDEVEVKEAVLEAEEPDSKDGESDTIDDVQSMLTKMLPKTKGLKLDKEKEAKIKSHLKSAMSLMGEEVEDVKKPESGMTDLEEAEDKAKADYPQYQFAIMLPREDYTAAMRTLNNSNIKAKTKTNNQKDKMAVIGFDKHNGTGDGKPEFTSEEVIKILKDVGIAATQATGIDHQKEPETLPVEVPGSEA